MTREEAIKYFKMMLAEKTYPSTTRQEAFTTALEALEKQATSDYASEWIPCSERLPDRNGTYLVTICSYDEIANINYMSVEYGNSDGNFLHYGTEKPRAKIGKYIVAWMPLPEPYKGE